MQRQLCLFELYPPCSPLSATVVQLPVLMGLGRFVSRSKAGDVRYEGANREGKPARGSISPSSALCVHESVSGAGQGRVLCQPDGTLLKKAPLHTPRHPSLFCLLVTLAKIDGVKQDGTREFRETFKVSAVIKGGDPMVDTPVGIVAKVFRVVSGQGEQDAAAAAAADAPLMVVLRRKRGDYHR